MDRYIYKNGKKLRCGYTTGTCAAAAAKAAAEMLLSGEKMSEITIYTPGGIELTLPVKEVMLTGEAVICGIEKDAGDDIDATDRILVLATVKKCRTGFVVEGGRGVGRVTKPGLKQKVGEAAINPVPKEMIKNALIEASEKYFYGGGLEVLIEVPEGEKIAEKTFNPRLGIKGGISILGTSGIVEPMSEQALVETIRAEISVKTAAGKKNLIITPGNYGQEFIKKDLDIELEECVKCSNFIGETIDIAKEYGIEQLLLIGHMGKLVKLGAGIFQTHSKMADGRMETLCACVIEAGGTTELAGRILKCNTTEEAAEILYQERFLKKTMDCLMERIDRQIKWRSGDAMQTGVILFSRQPEWKAYTKTAERMMADDLFCGSGTRRS